MWYIFNPYGEVVAGYVTEQEALEQLAYWNEHFDDECYIRFVLEVR